MRRTLFIVFAALCALTATGSAQATDSVRGRLVDQDGKPLAGERVVLHRVVGSTGANIAETQSGEDGRFAVQVDSADNNEAVYFLAARWQGELYIGEAFRAPFADTDYRLQVGVPGTSASALIDGTSTSMPPAAPPQPAAGSPATSTSWLLFAVPVISLLGVALYFALRARPAVSDRRLLLQQVAELDLHHAGSPDAGYQAERARLLDQLRQSPS